METSSDKSSATGFTDAHLNEEFFGSVVGRDRGKLISWEELPLDSSGSILCALAAKYTKRKIGHFKFRVDFKNEKGPCSLTVVVKTKAASADCFEVMNNIAQACGGDLAPVYEKFKRMKDEFRNNDVREVEIARLSDPGLRQHSPTIYHTINDPTKEIHVLVMEYLDPENVTLFNTDVSDPWQTTDIKVVLRDLARIHSSFLAKQQWLTSQYWLDVESAERMTRMQPLWVAMLQNAEKKFPEMWSKEYCDIIRKAFELIPSLWSTLEQAPRSLVHNDCTPRNLCLKKSTSVPNEEKSCKKAGVPFSDDRFLCLYDWEPAYAGAPQHDVVEFLSFTLPSSTTHSMRKELIEFYRQHLEYYSGMEFPEKGFHEVYNICCLDLAINRLQLYTMGHKVVVDFTFLARMVQTIFDHLTHEIATGGLVLDKD